MDLSASTFSIIYTHAITLVDADVDVFSLSLVCANENMWQADSTTQIKHFAAARIWKCQHQHRQQQIAPTTASETTTTTTTVGKGRSTYFFAIKIKCYQLKCSTAITSVVLYLSLLALGVDAVWLRQQW